MEVGLKHLIDPRLKSLVSESKQFYEARAAVAQGQTQPDLTTPDGLKTARAARVPPDPLTDRSVTKRIAEANGRQVPVRIITPKTARPRGVYLTVPGGGFYLSEAARGDAQAARLADALGVAVVSVDYRLAPENPWPAAPDDCAAAAYWLIKESKSMFGTPRLLIGGASAGATLTMTTLLRLRDKGLVTAFIGAVLQFGAYDLSGQTPGGRLYADEYFIQAYVGNVADKARPDISPLFGDLKGLPPALLVVGTADMLMEDSFAMAGRLSAAGNDVDLRIYPEAGHGFTFHPTKLGKVAREDMVDWLGQRLDR